MKLKVPYFDNLEVELEEEEAQHAAILAFLQLTPQNRIADSGLWHTVRWF